MKTVILNNAHVLLTGRGEYKDLTVAAVLSLSCTASPSSPILSHTSPNHCRHNCDRGPVDSDEDGSDGEDIFLI